MRQILLAVFAALALSGCVLHETPPLFTDADATLLLGAKPLTLAVFERKHGAWVASDDPVITAYPEATHYVVPDPATPNDKTTADRYRFIALDKGRYIIEALAKDEADYAIATWDGTTLLVSPLDCDALKTHLATNLLVVFENDSCSLQSSKLAPKELLAKLLPALKPPELRLVVK